MSDWQPGTPHRPWWKVLINTPLRWVQPWPCKWVVYSVLDARSEKVVGYGFGRVLHFHD